MVGSSANGGHASGGYFRLNRVKRQAMKKNTGNYVVLVTCGIRAEARKIARLVVAARLAACVNVLSAPVESIYRWKGKVETAKEFLLVMKTTHARFPALRDAITKSAQLRRSGNYRVAHRRRLGEISRVDRGLDKDLAAKLSELARAPDRDPRSNLLRPRFPPTAESAPA